VTDEGFSGPATSNNVTRQLCLNQQGKCAIGGTEITKGGTN